jgi:hypothetical protein
MYSAKLIAAKAKPNQTKILPFDYPPRRIFCSFGSINFKGYLEDDKKQGIWKL